MDELAVAATSHLPYVLSGALARAVARLAASGIPADALVGPGLEGMLRLAAQPSWMDEVVGLNAEHVGAALELLEAELGALRAALGQGSASPALAALGEGGRKAREGLLGGRGPRRA
jgi:prephenate dehydrogenase